MNINQLKNAVSTKYAAAGALLTLPVLALAADDIHAPAVQELTSLKVGVLAVGSAILAISIAAVGFFVIRRMVNRA